MGDLAIDVGGSASQCRFFPDANADGSAGPAEKPFFGGNGIAPCFFPCLDADSNACFQSGGLRPGFDAGACAAHRSAGVTIDGVGIAQGLQGFGKQDQGLALGVVDPALGGAAHVDHDEHGDIALFAVHAGEQTIGHIPAAVDVGAGLEGLAQALDQALVLGSHLFRVLLVGIADG